MSPSELSGDEVRAVRTMFNLSASRAASIVGLNDGAAWRKWERNGVRGPGAVLLKAIVESTAVRRYFKIGDPGGN